MLFIVKYMDYNTHLLGDHRGQGSRSNVLKAKDNSLKDYRVAESNAQDRQALLCLGNMPLEVSASPPGS